MKNQKNFESVEYINMEIVCQLFGLDFAQTKQFIQEDRILSKNFRQIEKPIFSASTQDNIKKRTVKFWGLSVQYYFGWLLQINPNDISPKYRNMLTEYQHQAHQILAEKIDLNNYFDIKLP